MKVDKELIERYHRQECTPDEQLAVEEWLLADTSDEQLDFPADHLEQAMWQEISSTLPKRRYISWKVATAAAILAAVICTSMWFLGSADTSLPLAVNNTSVHIKYISADDYKLSVGPKSTAMLNRQQGTMDFTGSLILQPKADMHLSLDKGRQRLDFKAGQTYILFNDGEVVVVNERNLMDMPPVLQQRISAEFKI